MWSSPLQLYPVHIAPILAPQGQGLFIEPQVSERIKEYLVVQPLRKPYEIQQEYMKRLWVC